MYTTAKCTIHWILFYLKLVDVLVGLFSVVFHPIKFTKYAFSVVQPNDNLSLHCLELDVYLLQVFDVLLAQVNQIQVSYYTCVTLTKPTHHLLSSQFLTTSSQKLIRVWQRERQKLRLYEQRYDTCNSSNCFINISLQNSIVISFSCSRG